MDEADMGQLVAMIGVSWRVFLLVPAHLGCPGQNPESRKMVVCVCACVHGCVHACMRACSSILIIFGTANLQRVYSVQVCNC